MVFANEKLLFQLKRISLDFYVFIIQSFSATKIVFRAIEHLIFQVNVHSPFDCKPFGTAGTMEQILASVEQIHVWLKLTFVSE